MYTFSLFFKSTIVGLVRGASGANIKKCLGGAQARRQFFLNYNIYNIIIF